MNLLVLLLLAQDPTLTLTTDLAAKVEIDGAPAVTITPLKPLSIALKPGEHQLVATPDSGEPYRKLVFIGAGQSNELALPVRAHLLRAEVEKQGYWTDPRTRLRWAAADSGSGVTVRQALAYCRQLAVAGFHDWRLPTIDELQLLFAGNSPADDRGFRLVAPLRLTGWAWSATSGNEPAENWTLDFGDGARASVAAGDAGLNRALCVR